MLGNAVRIAGCLGCLAAGLAGCAAPPVPPVLAFDRADYERVFEAAIESAREDGLEPVVADRDLGVIETAPRTAGSLVEPWRTDNADVEEMVAHTVNFERRRARFEFVPEGFAVPAPDPQGPSVGPAIPGSDRAEQRFDLMKAGGRIELRAWVYVDRAFLPNQSFGRWTLGETRYSTDPTQARRPDDPATAINTQWTPIGRDEPYEQRLMQRIHVLLADWRSDAADEAPTEAEPGH